MANQTDAQKAKTAIKQAQKIIQEVKDKNGNEAETRRRVERIFEGMLGYKMENLSREHAVRGAGVTEHLDFAIKLYPGEDKRISMVVELKRVGMELAPKHLKQASHYAIDLGCEWALLTNGQQWELYHIEFGKPPDTKLVRSWDLLNDEPSELHESFQSISYRALKQGELESLWAKHNALKPGQLLSVLLSEENLERLRRAIRKESGISAHPQEIISAFRKLLNEETSRLIDSVKISYPSQDRRRASSRTRSKTEAVATPKPDGALGDLHEELCAYLLSLGNDAQENPLKHYVGFKRDKKNFACISHTYSRESCLKVWLKIDPATVTLENGFIRDVRNVGHHGTGDLEVTIHNSEDLQKTKPLIQRSYNDAS